MREFLDQPIAGDWPYLWFDATCLKVRQGGRIISDNDAELTLNAILKWCAKHKVEWRYIALGKPMQNGFVESFNGKLRDDLLL